MHVTVVQCGQIQIQNFTIFFADEDVMQILQPTQCCWFFIAGEDS